MSGNSRRLIVLGGLALAIGLSTGCSSNFTRQGRSPSLLIIDSLEAAQGAKPDDMGGNLSSDVITNVTTPLPCSTTSPCPTIFNDLGEVTMRVINKDPGVPGLASNPSFLGAVTITHYHVKYRRTDGRDRQGVDVPYEFDSGVTFTVPNDGVVTHGFEIVRSTAKGEAPLRALVGNGDIINTIGEVTFYGHDQAGNDISAMGYISINFANFGD